MHNLPHTNQVIWKSIKKKKKKSFNATTPGLNANKRQGWAEKTTWTYLCKITQTACLQHTNRSCHIPATKVRKLESIIFLHWSAGFQYMPSFFPHLVKSNYWWDTLFWKGCDLTASYELHDSSFQIKYTFCSSWEDQRDVCRETLTEGLRLLVLKDQSCPPLEPFVLFFRCLWFY